MKRVVPRPEPGYSPCPASRAPVRGREAASAIAARLSGSPAAPAAPDRSRHSFTTSVENCSNKRSPALGLPSDPRAAGVMPQTVGFLAAASANGACVSCAPTAEQRGKNPPHSPAAPRRGPLEVFPRRTSTGVSLSAYKPQRSTVPRRRGIAPVNAHLRTDPPPDSRLEPSIRPQL